MSLRHLYLDLNSLGVYPDISSNNDGYLRCKYFGKILQHNTNGNIFMMTTYYNPDHTLDVINFDGECIFIYLNGSNAKIYFNYFEDIMYLEYDDILYTNYIELCSYDYHLLTLYILKYCRDVKDIPTMYEKYYNELRSLY